MPNDSSNSADSTQPTPSGAGGRSRTARLGRRLLVLIAPTLILVALLECIGWLLGPEAAAPLEDPETRALNARFYEPDPELIVRLRSNASFEYSSVRAELDSVMRTNANGYRGANWTPPAQDAFRVLVLGDSVTFGLGLDDGEEWPAVARSLLEQSLGHPVQLRSLAVPGYSTEQGRILADRHLHPGDGSFMPHIVVCGFGFNDGYLRDATDADVAAGSHSVVFRIVRWFREHSHFCALVLGARARATQTVLRVPPSRLAANLASIAAAADRVGATVVWADTALPYTYARTAMRAIGASRNEPMVAFRDVFHDALPKSRRPVEGRWPTTGKLRIEVALGDIPELPPVPKDDPRPPLYALWCANPSQRPTATRVALLDDGGGADQTADDGIYSTAVTVPAGGQPEITFGIPGFANAIPLMANDTALVLGAPFRQPGPTASPLRCDLIHVHSPPWPEWVLMPDHIHPNATGSRILAAAVAAAIRTTTAYRQRKQ